MLDESVKHFLINSFPKIGLTDPFPNEEESMNNEEDTALNNMMLVDPHVMIYPKCRIIHNDSPQPIYIPNRAMMFKLMRACIGITNPNDLWFNQNSS